LKKKKALITGVTGQDGSYLAELLIEKGYEVHGIKRRSSSFNTERIEHILQDESNPNCNFFTHYGDLTDSINICRLIQTVQPDEIYNLAAQSHVKVSFDVPEYSADANGIGTLRMLEAIRSCNLTSKTKFYQASTSELYGLVQQDIQNESTAFYPRSPYAVAKLYAYWITKNYREAYDMFAINGILFNHESPRRPENFVTSKIIKGLCRIKHKRQNYIELGNIDAYRDWGHAKDYVAGMWMMMQSKTPNDYVLATGHAVTIRNFIMKAARNFGLDIEWSGKGINETGYCPQLQRIIIKIHPRYFRPAEVEFLKGDASLARKELGWEPKLTLDDLIAEMIEAAENEII
jgi:GDPmannose 4,6-dehydratase